MSGVKIQRKIQWFVWCTTSVSLTFVVWFLFCVITLFLNFRGGERESVLVREIGYFIALFLCTIWFMIGGFFKANEYFFFFLPSLIFHLVRWLEF